MILTNELRNWLAAKYVNGNPNDFALGPDFVVAGGTTFQSGDTDPVVPGRFVLITPVEAPGIELDGLTVVQGFQVTSTGLQHSLHDAELLASNIDLLIHSVQQTKFILAHYVPRVELFGSRPSLLGKDNADRFQFFATYLIESASGLPM